jgi:hypothetical protein
MKKPLGVINNNPLNMRPDGRSKWQGLASPPTMTVGGQGEYLVFVSAMHGWRAAAVDLLGKQKRGGQMSIRKIVTIWAPAEDNNHPASYAAHVSNYTGINADQPIDLRDREVLKSVLMGMAKVELGREPTQFYSEAIIDQGIASALSAVPDQKPLYKSKTLAGSAMTGLGAVGGTVQEAGYMLQSVSDYAEIIKFVCVGLMLAGIALTVYSRINANRRDR